MKRPKRLLPIKRSIRVTVDFEGTEEPMSVELRGPEAVEDETLAAMPAIQARQMALDILNLTRPVGAPSTGGKE